MSIAKLKTRRLRLESRLARLNIYERLKGRAKYLAEEIRGRGSLVTERQLLEALDREVDRRFSPVAAAAIGLAIDLAVIGLRNRRRFLRWRIEMLDRRIARLHGGG